MTDENEIASAETGRRDVPERVAIVALGPSSRQYFERVRELGGRNGLVDEVWAVNGMGNTIACDRIFHMDDVLVQEARAAAKPGTNIATMMQWLKGHPGPIYTSTVRPGYPGLVEYPLEAVLQKGGIGYLNNTVAYAIAYARYLGVKELHLFGVDFTRPNIHHGERGRACCEFWLGLCMADGMKIEFPAETTLMDACAPPEELLYGYDGRDVLYSHDAEGKLTIEFREKPLPTAEEIERRYNHGKHTNRILAQETGNEGQGSQKV